MTSREQTTKTVSELLAEIGVHHIKSEIAGLRYVLTDAGEIIDQMDAADAANFYDLAQAAA